MPVQPSTVETRPLANLHLPSILILLVVLISLVWLRTFHPLLLPMFHDEGLHISRAQLVLDERTPFISSEGGKYLFIWLLALLLPSANDPLLVGRILSAGVGVLAGVGCYFLAHYIYQRDEVALTATAFYATVPYMLFFDRMAMVDGLLSALAIWVLLLSLVTVRHGHWWQTLALGVSLGLAAATKLTGVIFLAFPVLVAWFWRGERKWRAILSTLLAAWLLMVPWLLPLALNFTSHYRSTVDRSIVERFWMASEAENVPQLTRLEQNFNIIVATLKAYLTLPLLLLTLGETGRSLHQRDKSSWLLVLAALVTLTFFFLMAGADQFYPRYVLPAFPFLLILATRGLVALADWLNARWMHFRQPLHHGLMVGLALLVSLPAIRFDYLLLSNPAQVPWLEIDRWQHIDGWPAGYGVMEAATFLRHQADELGTIIVVKRAKSRLHTGNWVHYLDRPDIIFEAVDFGRADPQELIRALQNAPAPVFVVLDRPTDDGDALAFTEGPYAPYSTLAATFPRPGGASYIEVYRVVPKP